MGNPVESLKHFLEAVRANPGDSAAVANRDVVLEACRAGGIQTEELGLERAQA